MKNEKWNCGFPDVPEHVHQSVLDTLAIIERQEDKKMKKGNKMKKRTMILLAAALIVVLGTTAAAAELFKWNQKAAEIFEAEPRIQDQLVMEQIAQDGAQSVTDNGLTITAVQTIQDSRCFYALFEVTAEDTGILINEDCGLEYFMDFAGGEDPFCAKTWSFVGRHRQEDGNSRYFEIFGTKHEEKEEALQMNLHFTALTGPGEKAAAGDVLIQGNWDFSLTIHPASSLAFDLNREFRIAGTDVFVKSLDLSPLTAVIIFDGEDIRDLEKKEGINIDQLDVLQSIRITGIKYQDGTVIEQDGFSSLKEGFTENGGYQITVRFSHVIEPERAAAVLLGDNKDEIGLP